MGGYIRGIRDEEMGENWPFFLGEGVNLRVYVMCRVGK